MRIVRFLACALALGCLAPSLARSTTLLDQSVAQMTASAERVVIGKVSGVKSRLDRSAGGVRVMTEATLTVVEVLKGDASPAVVRLEQLGGTAGEGSARKTQVVAGLPSWREGEVVVVFLEHTDTGRLVTSGLSLGKYTLEPGSAGRVMARREVGELNRIGMRRPADRSFLGAPASEDFLALDDLRRLIRGERVRSFPRVLGARVVDPVTGQPPRAPSAPAALPAEVRR